MVSSPDDQRLAHLERLGYVLDNAIRIPGTSYRIGYDALIGLIPGVGDIVGLGLSAYIVLVATRYRLPFPTLLRMLTNIGLEAMVGAVPLLGDLFDATYKANARNLRLLQKHLHRRAQGGTPPSDRPFFVGLLLVCLVFLVFIVVLVLLTMKGLMALVSG